MGNFPAQLGCTIGAFFIVPILEILTLGAFDSRQWVDDCLAGDTGGGNANDGGSGRLLLRGNIAMAIDKRKPLEWIKPVA